MQTILFNNDNKTDSQMLKELFILKKYDNNKNDNNNNNNLSLLTCSVHKCCYFLCGTQKENFDKSSCNSIPYNKCIVFTDCQAPKRTK